MIMAEEKTGTNKIVIPRPVIHRATGPWNGQLRIVTLCNEVVSPQQVSVLISSCPKCQKVFEERSLANK